MEETPLWVGSDAIRASAPERDLLQQEGEMMGSGERIDLEIGNVEPLEFRDEHAHALGRWLGTLSQHPSAWPQREGGARLRLRMPDGETVKIALPVSESYGRKKGLRAGHVEGRVFSEVIVSYVNDAVVGVVRLPDEGVSWEIRNQGDGVLEFEKVDLGKLKGCAKCQRGEG